jgi:SAM-dependent methyltransferase
MQYRSQVSKHHYFTSSYEGKDRWISYWYQIQFVLRCSPGNILEIGPGNKTVTESLRKRGIAVTTVDIAADLDPDVLSSVTNLPFGTDSFDMVLAAEVLEHIPFEEFGKALGEIRRVSRRWALLSLPHAGYVFSFGFKVPLLKRFDGIAKIPFFWKRHGFNGEHYWELGKRGYPVCMVKKKIREQGFALRAARLYADDPAHYFFLLEKK